jgi:putative endonuclease
LKRQSRRRRRSRNQAIHLNRDDFADTLPSRGGICACLSGWPDFLLEPLGMNWLVYIILCTDDTLYTGITIDIAKRFEQHACGKGAKYFRSRQPKQLVYLEPGHNRSSATKREIGLKKLSRAEKTRLIASSLNKITELL